MRVKPPHASVRLVLLVLLLASAPTASAWTLGAGSAFRTMVKQDHKAPTAPGSLKVKSQTVSAITVVWNASRDNTGVVGYEVSVNGVVKATTPTTSYSVVDATCGTSYLIGVSAYDLAGNHSQKSLIIASTSPCDQTPPAPTADVQPPSAPSSLSESAASASQLALT